MRINDLLFVYGTLRMEGRLHRYLEGCNIVAFAQISGTMYDLGGFPCISIDGEDQIQGEIYKLDSQERIDSILVLEAGYDLSDVDINGTTVWVFNIPDTDKSGAPIVKSGDWIQYLKEKDRAA